MTAKPKADWVLVAVDNTGEPYVCREPVLYVRLEASTPLREPRRMLRAEFERLHGDWSRGACRK